MEGSMDRTVEDSQISTEAWHYFRLHYGRCRRRLSGLELLQFFVGDPEFSAATTQAYRKSRKDPDRWRVKTTSARKMDIDFGRKFTIHW
jgi:hypothetical protein